MSSFCAPAFSVRTVTTDSSRADVALGVDRTELSPGVCRMLALVVPKRPSIIGRRQMKMLAGLQVTTPAVERTAESIGGGITSHEQTTVNQRYNWISPLSWEKQLRFSIWITPSPIRRENQPA